MKSYSSWTKKISFASAFLCYTLKFDWSKIFKRMCKCIILWLIAICLPEMSVSQSASQPLSAANCDLYYIFITFYECNAVTVSFCLMSMKTNLIKFITHLNQSFCIVISINSPGQATMYSNWHWHHLNVISMNEFWMDDSRFVFNSFEMDCNR